tara:strand:+ start:1560 stop:1841 length:282 start_codon:yes stop_codon:yes gene_type:complete
MGKVNASQAVGEMSSLVLNIVISALVIGSILGATAFSTITIINVSLLEAEYGLAVVAITAFLAVGGTIIGILWFFRYVRELMDKKTGVNSLSA